MPWRSACSRCSFRFPNFWLAIVLILFLSVKLKLFPALGYQGFSYVILPALVLAVEIAPFIIRTLTTSLGEVMQAPFIDEARVRGLSRRRIVYSHALRNAAVPLVNLLGIQLSTLIGGVLVIEYIFDYPGLGNLTVVSVVGRDFPGHPGHRHHDQRRVCLHQYHRGFGRLSHRSSRGDLTMTATTVVAAEPEPHWPASGPSIGGSCLPPGGMPSFRIGFFVFIALLLASAIYPEVSSVSATKMVVKDKFLAPVFSATNGPGITRWARTSSAATC